MRHSPTLITFLLITLALPGCSSSNEATVTGAVTVDGTPLKRGSISFFPVDAKSYTSGADVVDGKYTARVPPGKMRIEIRAPKAVGQRKLYDSPNSPLHDVTEEALPAKYNNASELQLDVKPGENQKDYPLTTK